MKRLALSTILLSSVALGQELIPQDNGLTTYHTSPRYRASEEHPLRFVSYILHPIGWVAREVFTRPVSYLASSTETTRSVMGFREPFDYRQPECFSADDSTPDCRVTMPYNYESKEVSAEDAGAVDGGDVVASGGTHQTADGHVYMPDVNFDFNRHGLSDLGRGKVRQIADLLKTSPNLKIVLQGNTDDVGGDVYNKKLALDRAEAVKSELLALGISAERLETVSFGEAQPLYKEQDAWARAVNRRVGVALTE